MGLDQQGMPMSDAARQEDAGLHKVWKDAAGTVHKCEWLKVGDRKVPIAVTLCGQRPPPLATEPHDWAVTCESCNHEIEARHTRLVQGV
jgi:hypothetical protein